MCRVPPPTRAACLPQALKYAFQTHDRLCFVMEYANGGEVSCAAPARLSGRLLLSVGEARGTVGETAGAEGDILDVILVHLPPAP